MMTPINDPRPFAETLSEWIGRNELTYQSAADRLGVGRGSVGRALKGDGISKERAVRALMTLVDEGRA